MAGECAQLTKRKPAPIRPKNEKYLPRTKIGNIDLPAVNPEIIFKVCNLVKQGETTPKACEGLISYDTFMRWVMISQEAARTYMAAREISAYALEDEALGMIRALRDEPGDSNRVRAFDVGINQMRWSAARRNPRVFSEKAAVKITVPIQINTGLNLDPKQPAGEVTSGDTSVYTLEAKVETVQESETTAEQAMIGPPGTADLGKSPRVVRRTRRELPPDEPES